MLHGRVKDTYGMLEMAQAGNIPVCVAFAGGAVGVLGGVVAQVPTDPATGTAGIYVGVSGVILGAATLLGVLSEKFMPRFIEYSKMKAENAEEFLKNREARAALANDLQAVKLEKDALRMELKEERQRSDRNENLLIEARTRLEMMEREVGRVKAVAATNSGRLDSVEDKVGGSGDAIPAAPPAGGP